MISYRPTPLIHSFIAMSKKYNSNLSIVAFKYLLDIYENINGFDFRETSVGNLRQCKFTLYSVSKDARQLN